MSDELRMVFEANPALSDEEYVHRQLGIWNMKVTGFTDYYPVNFFLRDGEHRVRGALLAYVWGKWLHVETFWIEDNLRGQGWGKKMLEAAHEIGRQKGAEAAWLNTFSWQARSLYERFGYEAVFEIADFPPGHSRIYMRKQPL